MVSEQRTEPGLGIGGRRARDGVTPEAGRAGVAPGMTTYDPMLLATAVHAIRDAILVLEAVRSEDGTIVDERIVLANPAWREYALGSPDAPDPAGATFLQTVPHLAPRFDLHRRVIESGLPYRHTVETAAPDGPHYFSVEYSRLGDGVLSVARDITLDERAAIRLRASEEEARAAAEHRSRFALAMEHAPTGMAIVAPDGHWVEVNDALCRMFGHDAETLRSMRWQDLTHPDDLEVGQGLTDDVLAGRRTSYREFKRYLRADGRVVWGDLSVAAILNDDGSVRYFVSQVMDVTDRIEADRALRASEEQYRTLVAEIDGVVLVRDLVTGDVFCSPRVERMLGYAADEMASPGRWSELVVDEDRERAAARWAETETAGDFDLEYRMRRADGTVIWVEEHWRCSVDALGRPARWYGLATDITRRKRLEAAAVRTDRLEAVTRVGATAAVDFGSVLTAIQFHLGNLTADPDTAGRHAEDVTGISDAVDLGITLTKQLLEFGRERQEHEAAPIDVRWLLADLEPYLRGVAGRIPVELEIRDAGLIRIQRSHAEQILVCLVNNARDAMVDGGTITIIAERVMADPHVLPDAGPGPFVAIRVRDTGTGMSAEVRERAFERHFSTKPDGSGTGLTQVHAMARAAGGAAMIESRPGHGTTVSVLLPDHGTA